MNPQKIAAAITAGDSILTVTLDPGTKPVRRLDLNVGSFSWIDAGRVFVFEAGGENEFAGHVIEFSRAEAPHHLGVSFLDGEGQMIAYLAPLEEAGLPDEEYRRDVLRRWREYVTANPDILDFITTVRDRLAGK